MQKKSYIIDYIGKDLLLIKKTNEEFNNNHKRLKKIGKDPKKVISVIIRQGELLYIYFKYFEKIENLCRKARINSYDIFKVNLEPLRALWKLINDIKGNARFGKYKKLEGFYEQEEYYLENFRNQNKVVGNVKIHSFWGRTKIMVKVALVVLSLLASYPQIAYSLDRVDNGKATNETFSLAKFLNMSKTLSLFLENKRVEIRLFDGYYLNSHISKDMSIFAGGEYIPESNILNLPRTHSKHQLFHEVGHAVWDEEGNDAIFSDFFSEDYSGPSREDFRKALISSNEYKKQIAVVLEQFILKAYADLLSKFRGTEYERDIHLKYSKLCTKFIEENAWEFLKYSTKKGLDFDKRYVEARIVDETFAELFAKWMEGEHTDLDDLFNSMKYKGRNLKE